MHLLSQTFSFVFKMRGHFRNATQRSKMIAHFVKHIVSIQAFFLVFICRLQKQMAKKKKKKERNYPLKDPSAKMKGVGADLYRCSFVRARCFQQTVWAQRERGGPSSTGWTARDVGALLIFWFHPENLIHSKSVTPTCSACTRGTAAFLLLGVQS